MRAIRIALAAGLLAAAPALGQPAAREDAMRALHAAETGLRETLRRMDEGTLPGSMAMSRLRQAMNEVERAMLGMPAEARQGATWQAAVKEVSGAIAAARDEGGNLAAVRTAAGNALATLPALRGAEAGPEGG